MPVISLVIGLSGLLLEACVIFRLASARLLGRYPYVVFYLLCLLFRTLALPVAHWYWTGNGRPDLYATFYWDAETIGVLLRCLIVWELFRHSFPGQSALRQTVSRTFGIAAAVLAVSAVGFVWSYQVYGAVRSVNLTLDRSFGFAQAVFILGILLVGRHYGVCLGRNLWGIAIGFGAWLSLSTINYALFDLTGDFFPFWQFVRPLSFLGLLLMWNWALWRPSQISYITNATLPVVEAWSENWDRTFDSLRKVKPQ